MLSLASVKANRVRLLGSFVALLLGVTMLTLTALLLVSAKPQVPQRFSATTVAVTPLPAQAQADTFPDHPRWSIAEATALAEQLHGVLDTPFYAQAVIDGKPVAATTGNTWATAVLGNTRVTSGSAPVNVDEVAVPADLGRQPGDTVTILTAPGPREYRVSAVHDGTGLYFRDVPPETGVLAIGIFGDVDPAAVKAIVGDQAQVLAGSELSALEPPGDARTRWIGMQVLTAMGALSAFVAVFLVAATFSFSVLQRRREFGLLRAVGATPGQLRRLLLGEAVLVAAIAGAIGVALGVLGAPVVGGLLIDAGVEPASFTVRYDPLPMAAAYLTGIAVAVAGVWIASHRAARVRPLEALRVAEAERRPMTRSRWIGGVLAAAIGVLAGVATASADALSMPTYAGLTAMALVVAMSLLSPVVVPPLARVLMAPLSRNAVGLLVRQNAATAARRTAATAAPVLLTVAFTMLVTGMVATGASAYAARRADALPTAAVLVADGTPGLTQAVVDGSPGIALKPTTVFLGREPLSVMGSSLATGLTVSETLAAKHGWTQGSTVELTVASGAKAQWTVQDVLPDREVPLGVQVPAHLVPPSVLTQAVYLAADEVKTHGPGAKVLSAQDYAAQADAEEDRLVWTFTLILVGMAGGFTLIAVANTLLMATRGRLDDLLVLRKAGATPGQIRRLVAAETAVVVAIGAALGMVVATGALLAIRAGLSEQMGLPVPLTVPWPTIGVTVALCLATGLAASILPLPRR